MGVNTWFLPLQVARLLQQFHNHRLQKLRGESPQIIFPERTTNPIFCRRRPEKHLWIQVQLRFYLDSINVYLNFIRSAESQ
jgi:hypothetical protein